ncbi:hypothetical protein SARC_04945, partial [Sphaeroforma arctica JP610]
VPSSLTTDISYDLEGCDYSTVTSSAQPAPISTASASVSSSASQTPTTTPTASPSASVTVSISESASPSSTPSPTSTTSMFASQTPTPTQITSSTASVSPSPSASPSAISACDSSPCDVTETCTTTGTSMYICGSRAWVAKSIGDSSIAKFGIGMATTATKYYAAYFRSEEGGYYHIYKRDEPGQHRL